MANEYCLGNITNAPEPVKLFNGFANAIASYSLSDDISHYKMIAVYSCVNNGTYTYSNKDYILIDVDSMVRDTYEYRLYMNNTSGSSYSIVFCFPNNTTLSIEALSVKSSSWTNAMIYKVVGIK